MTGRASREMWGDLQYVRATLLPAAWLTLVLTYAGRRRHPRRRLLLLLAVEVIVLTPTGIGSPMSTLLQEHVSLLDATVAGAESRLDRISAPATVASSKLTCSCSRVDIGEPMPVGVQDNDLDGEQEEQPSARVAPPTAAPPAR